MVLSVRIMSKANRLLKFGRIIYHILFKTLPAVDIIVCISTKLTYAGPGQCTKAHLQHLLQCNKSNVLKSSIGHQSIGKEMDGEDKKCRLHSVTTGIEWEKM